MLSRRNNALQWPSTFFRSDRIGLRYLARPGWASSWKGFARDSAISKRWHVTGASGDQGLTWDMQWRVWTRKQQMEEKQDWAWTFWLDHVTWSSFLEPSSPWLHPLSLISPHQGTQATQLREELRMPAACRLTTERSDTWFEFYPNWHGSLLPSFEAPR